MIKLSSALIDHRVAYRILHIIFILQCKKVTFYCHLLFNQIVADELHGIRCKK